MYVSYWLHGLLLEDPALRLHQIAIGHAFWYVKYIRCVDVPYCMTVWHSTLLFSLWAMNNRFDHVLHVMTEKAGRQRKLLFEPLEGEVDIRHNILSIAYAALQ